MSVVRIANVAGGRLSIDTAALGQILDRVGERPVSIVSVNGPMRSGKSYLLNHLLRYLSTSGQEEDWFGRNLAGEFHWKNSSERQTTGILAWSEPLTSRDADGGQLAVLLLDTQGCFDDQTTTVENSLVFAFSCLMSSVLVYNVKNQLSEDVLQFLQMFVGYAKVVVDEGSDDSFSKLVLVIRDWQCPGDFAFGYHDDDGAPTPRNYKKEKMDVRDTAVDEVRVVHREILSSFRDVGCCLMPYPGNDLAYYDDARNVNPLFADAVRDLVPRVFRGSDATAKRVAGRRVTGNELKLLAERWARLFADADVPAVSNVAEATAEVQNAVAADVALKFYQGEMDAVRLGDGLSEDQFQSRHAAVRAEAVAMFARIRRLKNDAVQKRYAEQLDADLRRAYETAQAINAAKWQFCQHKATSERELQQLRAEMDRKIREAERRGSRGGRCRIM